MSLASLFLVLITVAYATSSDPSLHETVDGVAAHVDITPAEINQVVDLEDGLRRTPLHYAVTKSPIELVEILFEAGADANLPDSQRWTSLHWAANAGRHDLIPLLIQYGAQVNATSLEGMTPFDLSAQRGHLLTAMTLLQFGADAKATWTLIARHPNIAVPAMTMALALVAKQNEPALRQKLSQRPHKIKSE